VIELLALPVGVSRSAVASAIPIAIIAVAAGVICRIVPRIGDLGCLACVDPDVRALVVWGGRCPLLRHCGCSHLSYLSDHLSSAPLPSSGLSEAVGLQNR